jgi:MOSC domain-containing protein YiiM
LSKDNLPVGTRLAIDEAVVEVTAQPPLGCKLFANRYGVDAVKWVNSLVGKELRLRGLNAKVVTPGAVRVDDVVKKL